MSEVASQSLESVLLAVGLGLALLVGVFVLRRYMLAGLPTKRDRQQLQRARLQHKIQAVELAQLPTPTRRVIDVERVTAVIEGFDLFALQDRVGGWFREAQLARVGRAEPGLADHFLEGARDVAFASGEGLEGVGSVTVIGAALQKAGGSADGCEVHLQLDALVEEDRRGRRELVQVSERWALGWPPSRADWRVIRVERRWRRTLDAPRAVPGVGEVAARATVSPKLEEDLTACEVSREEIAAAARDAVARWVVAVDRSDPDELGPTVGPLVRDLVSATLVRHAWFDARPAWSLTDLDVEVARVLRDAVRVVASARVKGVSTVAVVGLDGEVRERWTGDWARYVDLAKGADGVWRFASVCDDDTWIV